MRLLGETEVVFTLWALPTLFIMFYVDGWRETCTFINSIDVTEAVYVAAAMVIALSTPILVLAARFCAVLIRLFCTNATAEWFLLMTVCPLFTVFMKDSVAMVLAALILSNRFLSRKPSRAFVHAMLAALFVNVSIACLASPLSSPAMIMISKHWNIGWAELLRSFVPQVLVAILLINVLFIIRFRLELKALSKKSVPLVQLRTPIWIGIVYWVMLILIGIHLEFPIIVVGLLLFFLGLHRAFFPGDPVDLAQASMTFLFIGSLMIHADLQGLWIVNMLEHLPEKWMLPATAFVSGFIDKTVVAAFAVKTAGLSSYAQYALASGACIGGGLTIIASAPNVAGYVTFRGAYGKELSLVRLSFEALPITLLALIIFVSL